MPDRRITPPEPEPTDTEQTRETLEGLRHHAQEMSISDEATGHLSEAENDAMVEEAKSHGELGPTPDSVNA